MQATHAVGLGETRCASESPPAGNSDLGYLARAARQRALGTPGPVPLLIWTYQTRLGNTQNPGRASSAFPRREPVGDVRRNLRCGSLRGCAYFNANLVGEETLKKPSAARIDRATIGNRNAQMPDEKDVDRTFSGQIDELMIFLLRF